jgi:3-hydroxyisobutyryl-CoA hydrolase
VHSIRAAGPTARRLLLHSQRKTTRITMWIMLNRIASITSKKELIVGSGQLFPYCLGKMRMSTNGSSSTTSTIQVLPSLSGNLGRIELNNPSGLNAINIEMVRSLLEILNIWQAESSPIKATLMIGRPFVNSKGETKPVFCAGGDVKSLYLNAIKDEVNSTTTTSSSSCRDNNSHGYGKRGIITADFFREEYALNHAIATQHERTKIPQISVWDGITMGGGVGVSIHGAYRVATENTIFAMPETSIGFFPDVGGLWFLSRLNMRHKGLGLYLALTGLKLTGAECTFFGLSTHFVSSRRLSAMYKELVDATTSDNYNIGVREVLDKYHCSQEIEDKVQKSGGSSLLKNVDVIERAFHQKDSVEELVASLLEEQQDTSFAADTLKTLRSRSPTSLKVTFEGMRRASQMKHIGECLQMEFRLSQAFMRSGSDFYEGIRAVLVDKDNKPKWNPSSLEEFSKEQVESFFTTLGENEWDIPNYTNTANPFDSGSKM